MLPPIKCIVLDLDGTLYDGVLGEDGAAGVELTEGHRALQRWLAEMQDAGMLLALASRNEPEDVETLFAQRSDFPLQLEHFSSIEVSWGDKAGAIARVAQQLRIGADAIVFVDDNPGELAAVAGSSPVVTVHARPDGLETVVALTHVAGMFRWHVSKEDRLRADDLRASAQRDVLHETAASPDDYLRSLQVRLEYHIGIGTHLRRVAELVKKTNQFNLSLRRMNEAEIAGRIEGHAANVIAIHLADRLSDSGIVGVVAGSWEEGNLRIEEVAVSCRALGRRIEDGMLTKAFLLMAEGRIPERIAFDVRAGPRNEPARQWLAGYTGQEVAPDAQSISMPFAAVEAKGLPDVVEMTVKYPEVLA
jgi:FkbH-like protein